MSKMFRRFVVRAKAFFFLDARDRNLTIWLLIGLAILQLALLAWQETEVRDLRSEINAIYRSNISMYLEQHRNDDKVIVVPKQPKQSY